LGYENDKSIRGITRPYTTDYLTNARGRFFCTTGYGT
jgi:hypothetical protein